MSRELAGEYIGRTDRNADAKALARLSRALDDASTAIENLSISARTALVRATMKLQEDECRAPLPDTLAPAWQVYDLRTWSLSGYRGRVDQKPRGRMSSRSGS